MIESCGVIDPSPRPACEAGPGPSAGPDRFEPDLERIPGRSGRGMRQSDPARPLTRGWLAGRSSMHYHRATCRALAPPRRRSESSRHRAGGRVDSTRGGLHASCSDSRTRSSVLRLPGGEALAAGRAAGHRLPADRHHVAVGGPQAGRPRVPDVRPGEPGDAQ